MSHVTHASCIVSSIRHCNPKPSVRSASSCTTPTHAAPRVPFLQRRITIPTSDPTPVSGLALHPHPHWHRPLTYRVLLPLSGLPSGQTQARGLPLLLLEQSAAVHSPPPVLSARVRLPVQLSARQTRLQILTHHLIRRTPFRPPAYMHCGPLQLAITARACPRYTSSAASPQVRSSKPFPIKNIVPNGITRSSLIVF